MPSFITTYRDASEPIPYATEEEVLEFANRLRELGGADPIEALFPSRAGDPTSCLIANALNFGCSVRPFGNRLENGEFEGWVMWFPMNMPNTRVAEIAYELGCFFFSKRTMLLPRLIGNAALAFDEANDGWTLKYRLGD